MASQSQIVHTGNFPCSDLYHMISPVCYLCSDVMKPPCVERHHCMKFHRDNKQEHKPYVKKSFDNARPPSNFRQHKIDTPCRYGAKCLSIGCIAHCTQPNFTPLQGTENCSKGDKCPAVVGCKFSHN